MTWEKFQVNFLIGNMSWDASRHFPLGGATKVRENTDQWDANILQHDQHSCSFVTIGEGGHAPYIP